MKTLALLFFVITAPSFPQHISASAADIGTLNASANAGNLMGAVDIRQYGAKCDGTTDDTGAFNSAAVAAFGTKPGNALVIPATGSGCVISQWNLTGYTTVSSASVRVRGMNGSNGRQSTIICKEAVSNTGNCIDLSGSDYVDLEDFAIQAGTSTSNAPKTGILLANNSAFSEAFYFRNITIATWGQFAFYTYGGELLKCENCNFGYSGPTNSLGEAVIMISDVNTRGITSSFQHLLNGPISMTAIAFDEGTILNCGAITGSCVELDDSTGLAKISNITISGYANLGKDHNRAFLSDLSTSGALNQLHITPGVRVESQLATDQLLVLKAADIKGLEVDGVFADSVAPSVPEIQFLNAAGSVGEGSYINLQPGDVQIRYPGGKTPSNVITCAGTQYGLLIYSRNKYGFGNMPVSCPGAIIMQINGISANSLTSTGFAAPVSQGGQLAWNKSSTQGETDFVNNHGSGTGGWRFYDCGGTCGTQALEITINANGTITSAGAMATLSGTGACSSRSGQLGGSFAGQITCTGATAASTLTIAPGNAATNGWSCWASDLTTAGNILRQSSVSTTVGTIAGTVNANDVITFGCIGY